MHTIEFTARGAAAALALAVCGPACGAGNAAPGFSELASRLAEHPSAAALRQAVDARAALAEAAAALPDPAVRIGVANLPIADPAFDRFLPTHKAVGVRQALPSGAARRARAALARHRTDRAAAALAQRLAQLRAELVATLADRRRVDAERALRRDQDARYGELAAAVASEIAAGRGLAYRLAEVAVERAEVGRGLAMLDGEAARIDARLRELVGVAAAAPPPEVPLRPWSGAAADFHRVRLAQAEHAAARAEADMAQATLRPDWALEVVYQQRRGGAGFSGDDWLSASVSVSVPLWARRSQLPRIRAARQAQRQAGSGLAAAQRGAAADWESLQAEWAALGRSVQLLDAQIAAADERIAALRTRYAAGAGSYAAVLDARIARLALRVRRNADAARRIDRAARANGMQVAP